MERNDSMDSLLKEIKEKISKVNNIKELNGLKI